MTDERFAEKLKLAVVGGMASQEVQDPLDWLYRAMRDAGAEAGHLRDDAHHDHLTTYSQPFHIRLVSAIGHLSTQQYALLALFMWGARCEDVAEWQTTSQEEIAARVNQIARELAAHVFGTRP